MESKQVTTSLAALSHVKRLEVFRALIKRGPQGYAAGAIAQRVGLPGPTLSFHLKALEHAGLVVSRQEGRFLFYTANFATMTALIEFLSAECCSLADDACAKDCVPAAAMRKRRKQ